MAGSLNKKYGLIVPKKAQQQQLTLQSKLSAFADDSDEESSGLGPMTLALFKVGSKTVVKKKTRDAMNKALAEDPTVYEYDSIYEKLEQQKEDLTNKPQKIEKKARYIGGLLEAAKGKKKELELIKIQKERKTEGEKFVTSSYRKKMEMQNELLKQKEEDEMEGQKKLPESSSERNVESNYNSNNESRKVENVERAQKKRRHDSSCSDDDNQAERKKKESEDSVNDKNAKDKSEQEREEVEKRRSVFARRNFEEEINTARERYFARIQAKLLVVKNLPETTAA